MTSSISIENLKKDYGILSVFNRLQLQVKTGEIMGVRGQSGIGKSTLLRCICELEEYSGHIQVQGQIAFMPQNFELFPWNTVRSNIILPLRLAGKTLDPNFYGHLLDLLEIREYEHSYPNALSGGEAQRVALAMAMIIDPEILLLDEPFNNLNQDLGERIMERLILYSRQKQKTVLITSHNDFFLRQMDRIIELAELKHSDSY
jgi:ABC-type nitrate/sulfonate/bicarbonate transport system ATPase subunit